MVPGAQARAALRNFRHLPHLDDVVGPQGIPLPDLEQRDAEAVHGEIANPACELRVERVISGRGGVCHQRIALLLIRGELGADVQRAQRTGQPLGSFEVRQVLQAPVRAQPGGGVELEHPLDEVQGEPDLLHYRDGPFDRVLEDAVQGRRFPEAA